MSVNAPRHCGPFSLLISVVVVAVAGCAGDGGAPHVRDEEALVALLSRQDFVHSAGPWAETPDKASGADAAEWMIAEISGQFPTDAADLPRFFVRKAKGSEEFWVMKSGGIAGGTTWRGPFVMSADGEMEAAVTKAEGER